MERRKYSLKVLLVDGDVDFLNYERDAIDNITQGKIYTALDGEKALEIFKTNYPDIVLMNIDLQYVNGYELISRIREMRSIIDSYILVVSDSCDTVDQILALRLGANNYLVKPIETVKLINYFYTAVDTITSIFELKFEKYILQEMVCMDSLTGLANSAYLLKRYKEEMAKAFRYKRNLACMRLNFDDFEGFQLKYGKTITEIILKNGSNIIRNCLRKCDVVGRIEDSEFGILLPETNILQAKSAGAKVQETISRNEFSTDSGVLRTTVSIGISSNASQQDEADSIFAKAEKALKDANVTGPNSIILNS